MQDVSKRRLYVVVNLVHAQVEMLELWVFDRDPLLNVFSGFVLSRDLLNVVELWHWLLWLLGCLKLFVLFNDGVSLLELSKLILDLVLRKWEPAEKLQHGNHALCVQAQLRQAEVLNDSILTQNLTNAIE